MKKILFFFVLLLAVPCFSQTLPPEEAAVRATIDRLFEAMRKGDSTLARSVFHPTARLQSAYTNKEGKVLLQSDAIAGFLKAVGTPHKEGWDERVLSYEIRIDENMATAWTPYEFYLDGKYLHEGVNAFQLFRGSGGWQIIQICDTRRRKPGK